MKKAWWKAPALIILLGCGFNLLATIVTTGTTAGKNDNNNGDNDSNYKSSQNRTTAMAHAPSTIDGLRAEHPACFSEDFPGGVMGKVIKATGEWVKIGRDATRPVRYTHLCRRIKPRYNCARNASTPSRAYGDVATDWKLILRPPDPRRDRRGGEGGEACNLWEFASSLGGPRGLAEHLLSKRGGAAAAKTNAEMITVLMSGNSYVRQLFEALACGFEDDISDLRLQKLKHYEEFNISKKGLKRRGIHSLGIKNNEYAQLFTTSEAGEFERPADADTGTCRPNANISMYYEDGVALPLECYYDVGDHYVDELAMVEFGGKIRFYYVFRPFIYANFTEVLRSKLRLDPRDVDMLVFNAYTDGVFRNYPELVGVFNETGAWQSKIKRWPFETFRKKQLKYIGRFFGADNPWIDPPPDDHPCMPGMPDDEVNMLLWWMLMQQE